MAYNNLQNRVTSVETASFTNGTGLSYSTIASLTSGVPHVDQLEVERIFDLDTTVTVGGNPVNIQDNISAFDLHKIFILEKTDYTLNESTSTLTTITIPGNRTYTIAKAKNNTLPAGTVISIPVFSNGQKVIVRRKTLSFDPYVTWTAGTRLTSEQLNLQVQQLLRLNQELIYKMESEYLRVNDIAGENAPAFDVANSLDMKGNKIISLGDPTAAQDGATKNYVDTALTGYVATTGVQTIAGAKTFSNAVVLSSTLAVTGASTLTGNTTVGGTLQVSGGLGIAGAAAVNNTLNIGVGVANGNRAFIAASGTNCIMLDTDALDPRVTINGSLSVDNSGSLTVAGTSTLTGAATLQSTLAVTGATSLSSATVSSTLGVTGATTLSSTLGVTGATTLSSTLGVTGAATFSSTVASTGTVTAPNIKITGTASADVNTLDYYEENTFTPKYQYFNGTSWLDVTATYDVQQGRYTRIGNMVYCHIRLRTTAATPVLGTNYYMGIAGFPFPINATVVSGSALAFASGWTTLPNAVYVESSNRVYLNTIANGTILQTSAINASSSNQVMLSFFYFTS